MKGNGRISSVNLHLFGENGWAQAQQKVKYYGDLLNEGDLFLIVNDSQDDIPDLQAFKDEIEEFYPFKIQVIGQQTDAKLFEFLGMPLEQFLMKPSYANGRNKLLLYNAIYDVEIAHFFDLDTLPDEDSSPNIVQEHEEIIYGDSVIAVSGAYSNQDPKPLTTVFFNEHVQGTFERIVTTSTGLGPNGQVIVGGVHAVHRNLYSQMGAPPMPMTIFSDDAFVAKLVEWSGLGNVVNSHLAVRHLHTDKRVGNKWVLEYLSKRLARSVVLLPLASHIQDELGDIIATRKSDFKPSQLRQKLEMGKSEASENLRSYIDGLVSLQGDACIGSRCAVRRAIELLIKEREKRIEEVIQSLMEYTIFLPLWQEAMQRIANERHRIKELINL